VVAFDGGTAITEVAYLLARDISSLVKIVCYGFSLIGSTSSTTSVQSDRTKHLESTAGIPGATSIQFANPFYGQGTIFQYPSSLRLGIKFQF
jgi:hypothetical protein